MAAIALSLALVWASLLPQAGAAFGTGGLHVLAHLAAYALLAYCWRRGLSNVPAPLTLFAVVAFGFAQEAIEISGHAHPFELADALLDAAGAIAGALAARAALRQPTAN